MKLTESCLCPVVGRDDKNNPIEKVTKEMIAGIIGISKEYGNTGEQSEDQPEAKENYKDLEPV